MKQETLFSRLIPTELENPDFILAWVDWLADRKERRKPVTERSAKVQLRKLAEIAKEGGIGAAVASIEQSIERGYAGIFPPAKTNGKATFIATFQETKPAAVCYRCSGLGKVVDMETYEDGKPASWITCPDCNGAKVQS